MKYILHVDNSEFFQKLMKTCLSEMGHESKSYTGGEDAVKVVASGEAFAVIMGLELSDMSGEEFIKRLIVLDKKPPIFVVTSNEEEKRAELLKALGITAIIHKSGDWKSELAKYLN
jgi:CheY-like chemotaxis protein